MERPWLESYPPGVPAEIDVNQYGSLKAVVEESCRRFADAPAYSNLGRVLTYRELEAASARFGAWLRHEAGLNPGDRVAIMLPNLLQYPVALFGVLRAGLTVVNVNPLYTARELEHQLADSGARAIVILENFAHTLQRVNKKTALETVVVTRIGDMLPFPKNWLVTLVVRHLKGMVPPWSLPGHVPFRIPLHYKAHSLPQAELTHDDVAFLQYTGGTTGVSKGAVLTHGNLVANLQQVSAWLAPFIQEGKEVIITALPLYHIFSLTANCLFFGKIGAHNVLITNPRDLPHFVKELGKVPFTAITGVNTLYNALLNTPGFDKLDFSHLHLTLGGGMAVQQSVAERWKRVTGVTLVEAYGLTETSPAACINPMDLAEYNGSIGLPIPSTEVMVCDDAGNEVPLGQVGELCIRGPQVMREYWQRPDETVKVLREGWLHTGDMATLDERGFVRIVDRKKDLILVSGFNVYPNEVEDVAALHPGVLEVAAVGVPDGHSGESVKLVVVRKDPTLSAEALIAHCREHLTRYKVPRQVEFREELPKTNVGKILRRVLREGGPTL